MRISGTCCGGLPIRAWPFAITVGRSGSPGWCTKQRLLVGLRVIQPCSDIRILFLFTPAAVTAL